MRVEPIRRLRQLAGWISSERRMELFLATGDTGPAVGCVIDVIRLDEGLERGLHIEQGALGEALCRKALPERRLDQCFLAVLDGAIVGHGWVRESGVISLEEVGVDFELPQDTVAMFDFLVAPAARGRGVYRSLLTALRCRYSGRAAIIFAESWNQPSRRGIVAAGFETVLTINAAKRFGRYKVDLIGLHLPVCGR